MATLPPRFTARVATIAGRRARRAQRVVALELDPRRPAVALIARPIDDPARRLPLAGELVAAPPGATAAYVSEAMVALYGAHAGRHFDAAASRRPPRRPSSCAASGATTRASTARSSSTRADWQPADRRRAGQRPRALARAGRRHGRGRARRARARRREWHDPTLLDFASPREIRAISLRIFDRSFAVTYWLQAVAIAIGLFGIAASFSAQVLARRKEFGLLVHLGLTRRQILAVVAGEGAVWTAVGAAARARAGHRRERGARPRRQPAELPLDDGPAAALAAPRGAVRRRRRRGRRSRLGSRPGARSGGRRCWR